MQATANSEGAPAAVSAPATDPSGSDYVGRHRPHKLSLLHARDRVSRLVSREADSQSK